MIDMIELHMIDLVLATIDLVRDMIDRVTMIEIDTTETNTVDQDMMLEVILEDSLIDLLITMTEEVDMTDHQPVKEVTVQEDHQTDMIESLTEEMIFEDPIKMEVTEADIK